MENCPNCHAPDYDGTMCRQCSHTPLIGPGRDVETTPHLDHLDHLEACPGCAKHTFDGWNCSSCGYEIPDKAKTAHGRRLSSKDAADLKRRLGIE